MGAACIWDASTGGPTAGLASDTQNKLYASQACVPECALPKESGILDGSKRDFSGLTEGSASPISPYTICRRMAQVQ